MTRSVEDTRKELVEREQPLTASSTPASASAEGEARNDGGNATTSSATAAANETTATEIKDLKGGETTTSPNGTSKKEAISEKSEKASLPNPVLSPPSQRMTFVFLLYWILPVFLMALFSRFVVDTEVPKIDIHGEHPRPPKRWIPKGRNEPVDYDPSYFSTHDRNNKKAKTKPTSSRESISSRQAGQQRQKQQHQQSSVSDRDQMITRIEKLRRQHKKSSAGVGTKPADDDNSDVDTLRALELADLMRHYDNYFQEGGKYMLEGIDLYRSVVTAALRKRRQLIDRGEPTNVSPAAAAAAAPDVSVEWTVDYHQKSVDGILCAAYTGLGKLYASADLLERSAESYGRCLDGIESRYLDALVARGKSLLLLGRHREAGEDLLSAIRLDRGLQVASETYPALSRVLEADDSDAVEGGWDVIAPSLEQQLVPQFESQMASAPVELHRMLSGTLSALHRVLFRYHNRLADDASSNAAATAAAGKAWKHLAAASRYKADTLPPWPTGFEMQRAMQTAGIFGRGFWGPNVGTESRVPVFLVGFAQDEGGVDVATSVGSSALLLLGGILNAHPDIDVRMGENSVLNGRLDDIKGRIVRAGNDPRQIARVTRQIGDEIVEEMIRRWEFVNRNAKIDVVIGGGGESGPKSGDDNDNDSGSDYDKSRPSRLVDKLMMNYYNIGMIHMLFPKALILHVAREPMDALFSAHARDYSSAGTLDYACDFDGLSEQYQAYRRLMGHWDDVLPGRVRHILYRDLLADLPSAAKAVFRAAGVPWDDRVLDYLDRVNERGGLGRNNEWKRYKEQLQPLADKIGDEFLRWDLETNLPGFQKETKQKGTGRDEL